MINEPTHAALARLTENERTCLRRRLAQQTAKEMALDLGISPHAVEKRLKMARAKLGLSSSLAAARLLAQAEGGGQLGPQASDLAASPPINENGDDAIMTGSPTGSARWRRRSAIMLTGVLVMSLAAAIIALATAPSATAPIPATAPSLASSPQRPADFGDGQGRIELVKAPPETIRAFVDDAFGGFDGDRSGTIEPAEVPAGGLAMGLVTFTKGPPPSANMSPGAPLTGKAAQSAAIALWDRNRDGKLDRQEFAEGLAPEFLRLGAVPVAWRGARALGNEKARRIILESVDHVQFVPASPETIRKFVDGSFMSMDKDASGFIERSEAPPMPLGNVSIAGPGALPEGADDRAGRALWIARADTDGDGRVSRDEFAIVTYPIFANRGVPANWKPQG